MATRCELVSRRRRGVAGRAALWFALVLTTAIAADTAAGPAVAGPLTRSQLIGVWRLVRIDYAGPHGERTDPFYQAGSQGVLVYDAGGWMSCQIAAPGRSAPRDGGAGVGLKGLPDGMCVCEFHAPARVTIKKSSN